MDNNKKVYLIRVELDGERGDTYTASSLAAAEKFAKNCINDYYAYFNLDAAVVINIDKGNNWMSFYTEEVSVFVEEATLIE